MTRVIASDGRPHLSGNFINVAANGVMPEFGIRRYTVRLSVEEHQRPEYDWRSKHGGLTLERADGRDACAFAVERIFDRKSVV